MGGSDRDQAVEPRGDLFPWLVTLGCLLAALVLFVHSTMPALAERRALREVQDERIETLQQTIEEARDLRRQAANLRIDVERILVEMDRQGISPDRLPPEKAATSGEPPR